MKSNSVPARWHIGDNAWPTVNSSGLRFPDGSTWRVEIPSVEGIESMRAVVKASDELGVTIGRVSQGSGIMLLSDAEIEEMVELGDERTIEVCLFVGPRAGWDVGIQASTPGGATMAGALRGSDGLRNGVEEVVRACRLGVRSVLISDFGLLATINDLRRFGDLPSDLRIKTSASMAVANPATARVVVELGAATINIAGDLTIAQMAAIREQVEVPLDIYIEGPDELGAPLRYYDMPEIVRTLAPVHLKFAIRNSPSLYPSGRHIRDHVLASAYERVNRAKLGLRFLEDAETVEKSARAATVVL